MKLFALRAADYMRAASREDRRYLLYNPMVKMKVTTQGEEVINLLWDAIAAKGFEKDTYFSQAAVDIRALPKLEGTVHVNIALIVKFMPSFFFDPGRVSGGRPQRPGGQRRLPLRSGRREGPRPNPLQRLPPRLRGLRSAERAVCSSSRPRSSARCSRADPPGPDQMKDVDFLLAGGEIFALVVYAQLMLENAPIYGIDDDLLDQIFDFMVRDVSKFALQLYSKPITTAARWSAAPR